MRAWTPIVSIGAADKSQCGRVRAWAPEWAGGGEQSAGARRLRPGLGGGRGRADGLTWAHRRTLLCRPRAHPVGHALVLFPGRTCGQPACTAPSLATPRFVGTTAPPTSPLTHARSGSQGWAGRSCLSTASWPSTAAADGTAALSRHAGAARRPSQGLGWGGACFRPGTERARSPGCCCCCRGPPRTFGVPGPTHRSTWAGTTQ